MQFYNFIQKFITKWLPFQTSTPPYALYSFSHVILTISLCPSMSIVLFSLAWVSSILHIFYIYIAHINIYLYIHMGGFYIFIYWHVSIHPCMYAYIYTHTQIYHKLCWCKGCEAQNLQIIMYNCKFLITNWFSQNAFIDFCQTPVWVANLSFQLTGEYNCDIGVSWCSLHQCKREVKKQRLLNCPLWKRLLCWIGKLFSNTERIFPEFLCHTQCNGCRYNTFM